MSLTWEPSAAPRDGRAGQGLALPHEVQTRMAACLAPAPTAQGSPCSQLQLETEYFSFANVFRSS